MYISEWLKLVGFHANPFGSKQADEEQEFLTACFVEHPTYRALRDSALTHTSILHAPRGAGKSTICLMLEEYYTRRQAELCPLIVQFKDWLPLIEVLHAETLTRLDAYIAELLRQIVVGLARQAQAAWLQPPADQTQHSILIWLCQTYGSYLLPQQRSILTQTGWLPDLPPHRKAVDAMDKLARRQVILAVLGALQAAGMKQCLMFIDRVDETEFSIHDPAAAVQLVAPLLSNQFFLETPGIVYKFFLPTEVVEAMLNQHLFRADRVRTYALHWDGERGNELLSTLLRLRLEAFSDGSITSLDVLATPELHGQVDRALIESSSDSPRILLIAGDLLLETCATDPDTNSNNFFIKPAHLELMRKELPAKLASLQLGALSTQPALLYPNSVVPAPALQDTAVPLLSIEPDGKICRGGQPIEGWERLTRRQRAILEYLYNHPDQAITTEQLIQDVWRTFLKNREDVHVVTDDAVRKMMDSISKFLEPDSIHPVYLEKQRGGRYCLRHAASGQHPRKE